jgi:hypothetical protein
MIIQDELKKYKTSDICFVLGSGSSINEITTKQWEIISKYDTIGINSWVYHDFVPSFYYIELKNSGNERSDIKSFKYHYDKKKHLYTNTKFISIDKWFDNLQSILEDHEFIYGVAYNKRQNCDCEYGMDPKRLTHSCGASLSLIIELLYKMKYTKIVLLGVDLYNSGYFWTGNNSIQNTLIQSNKNKNFDENHSTYGMIDFVVEFNKKYMKTLNRVKRGIYIGTKNSALYKMVPYFDLDSGKSYK